MTGRLADFDRRALRTESADARILATARGKGGGIARISVSVAGKPIAERRARCRPACPQSARLEFTYSRHRFGTGHRRVVIEAADRRGSVARKVIHVEEVPRTASEGAPNAGPAFYITASSEQQLSRQAYQDAATFARGQASGHGLLILDFGAARLHGGTYGVRLRGGTFFSDQEVHRALNSAARGFHDHRRGGSVTIVYAASNALLGAGGNGDEPLTEKTAHQAGRHQALALRGLELDAHEAAAVGGDIEPGYDLIAPPSVSVSLVEGAISVSKYGRPYYDVGTAPCNGDKCINGWSLRRDICAVASGPGRLALPEIYYGPPLDQAEDWTAAAEACRIHAFAGASGEKSADYTPAQSWRVLRSRSKANVGRILVVFPE